MCIGINVQLRDMYNNIALVLLIRVMSCIDVGINI